MIKDVHAQLNRKIKELGNQIEKSYGENRVPAQYSLGVVNGLILAAHILDGRQEAPKFYANTTQIGVFPKPVVLRSDNAIKNDAVYQNLVDNLILAARNFMGGILPKAGLQLALERLDQFQERKMEELSEEYEAHRQG